MKIIFLGLVVLVFVFVLAYLLMQQKENKMKFYDELQKEDKLEIDKILNEEKLLNEKFKIISKDDNII